jgi:arylsulfatase
MPSKPSLRVMMALALLAAAAVAAGKAAPILPAPAPADSRQIPPPPPRFGGVIKPSAADSKPWWPPRVAPPKGAPNVLLIMTDDAGYGVPGTFGGVIPTPAMDRVANAGLRYTQFHSTALCSPTRAALITGRNHHAVGFGVIAEQVTGFPGYDGIIGVDNATVGKILQENGYATSWFGKDHNTPISQYGVAGPFDQWPVGLGFQYFYGFLGGQTDQWTPFLFRDTTQVFPWVGKPGYNLTTDLADDAIRYLRQLDATAPDQPFLLYFVPGGTHAPHQPTREWIDRFRGKFDMGWNALREQIFANQKHLGTVPAGTKLTPWPSDLPRWDKLTADEKKLFARQAEVYAGYVAYTDHEIGRVIQAVDDLHRLDNTLVIYIGGDNGTSAEGSLDGTPNALTSLQGVPVPVAAQMKFYDAWGSATTAPHMAAAWAWAFDTPFKWTKQVASHFGGTRQNLTIAWPRRIKDAGAIRTQFHHVIDIVPTILEAAGIRAPALVDGIEQKPLDGVSMIYSWAKANEHAPSHRQTQYFEMLGNRAIYHDGWLACTTPPAAPWEMGLGKMPRDVVNGYKWELYDVGKDFSEADDLAAKMPDKLHAMQQLFTTEAAQHGVFPLDNTVVQRLFAPRPSATAGRTTFLYAGEVSGIPAADAPSIIDKSYAISADVEVPAGGGDGMLVTLGGRFGGYGLYLLKGKPVFVYNFLGLERFRWEALAPLAAGKHTVSFEFRYDGPGLGKGGAGVLRVDGTEANTRRVPHTIPFLMTIDETFDVGVDTRTPVDDNDYQVPFRFNGKIDRLTVRLGPPQLTEADRRAAKKGLAAAGD